jgi:hypothetical protein
MKTALRPLSPMLVGFALAVLAASSGPLALRHPHSGATVTGVPVSLPLSFEANRGQAESQVHYLARGPGYTVFLLDREAVLALKPGVARRRPPTSEAGRERSRLESGAVVRIQPGGGGKYAQIQALDQLPGTSNYFIGSDPARWRTGIPTYGKVKYEQLYPGIDLAYYGRQRQLEFDFVVGPGADPSTIGLAFQGVDDLEIGPQGDLVLKIGGSEVRMQKPCIYQVTEAGKRRIPGEYALKDKNQVGFMVAAYDTSKPLVIDPALVFSTYLGGGGEDSANGIFVDGSGNIFLTGTTASDAPNAFPTTTGAYSRIYGGSGDVFVTKVDPVGPTLLYSTYLGGGGQDSGNGIYADGSGNAYVTGSTKSSGVTGFPTTPGAFQTSNGGSGTADAFVTKLNPSGTDLLYSTYLGGADDDVANGIYADGSGNAYVTGSTTSDSPNPFPTTLGAFSRTYGGSGDAFVTKLNPAGLGLTDLVYSTYLGGAGQDAGNSIFVDSSGDAYVTGSTTSDSPNPFPTTAGASSYGGSVDAFVTKINAAATALIYSTYLGGRNTDVGKAISVNGAGDACVGGSTNSPDFPLHDPLAGNNVLGGGTGSSTDAFVAIVTAVGTMPSTETSVSNSGGGGGCFIATASAFEPWK